MRAFSGLATIATAAYLLAGCGGDARGTWLGEYTLASSSCPNQVHGTMELSLDGTAEKGFRGSATVGQVLLNLCYVDPGPETYDVASSTSGSKITVFFYFPGKTGSDWAMNLMGTWSGDRITGTLDNRAASGTVELRRQSTNTKQAASALRRSER